MIAYRDFLYIDFGLRFWQEDDRAGFETALSEANEWIDREAIDVLNVGNQASDRMFKSMIRVWYRKPASKAANVPEV